MKTIVLVACVSKKLDEPAPAKDLYQSTWFKKARAYAEKYGDAWYILSARHGLVKPEQVLEPYNVTLPARKSVRATWAAGVWYKLREVMEPHGRLVFLAGKRYTEPLAGALRDGGQTVEAPLAGMGIGQQLHWLNGQLAQAAGQ